jgi:hypothetical protein
MTPLLEDPRDSRLRGQLVSFGFLFVCSGGAAIAIAVFADDSFDWLLAALFLPFGVTLMWKALRDILDRRRFILFVVGATLFGTLLGAAASPYIGGENEEGDETMPHPTSSR